MVEKWEDVVHDDTLVSESTGFFMSIVGNRWDTSNPFNTTGTLVGELKKQNGPSLSFYLAYHGVLWWVDYKIIPLKIAIMYCLY